MPKIIVDDAMMDKIRRFEESFIKHDRVVQNENYFRMRRAENDTGPGLCGFTINPGGEALLHTDDYRDIQILNKALEITTHQFDPSQTAKVPQFTQDERDQITDINIERSMAFDHYKNLADKRYKKAFIDLCVTNFDDFCETIGWSKDGEKEYERSELKKGLVELQEQYKKSIERDKIKAMEVLSEVPGVEDLRKTYGYENPTSPEIKAFRDIEKTKQAELTKHLLPHWFKPAVDSETIEIESPAARENIDLNELQNPPRRSLSFKDSIAECIKSIIAFGRKIVADIKENFEGTTKYRIENTIDSPGLGESKPGKNAPSTPKMS
ncbi:MAG: hypothetical protein FWG93_04995 [Oscillospiraceae bacterium]|nr:hypothetical protein [Oscillospiraceae bacterium]